ncbi:cytochrome c oxidase assembly protein [Kineococcus sp. LSe6-4]|uniref:Cytochrome c oxidase assembly protein n=1 Tax=Kineococcus halophytocola TaxID=3234027 RepID=A0ABV4H0V7_9ACTN
MTWAGLLVPAVLLPAGYLALEQVLHRRGDAWPVARSAAVLAAGALLAVAASWPEAGPAGAGVAETVRHLLATMAAPVLLALSGPVALVLRVLPPRPRRVLVRLLHSRWARAVTWWPVATVLAASGAPLFYLAPVPHGLHGPLMVHTALASWLFATVVAGPDPVRGRPGAVTSTLALLVVAAVHGVSAKLWFAAGAGPAAELLFVGGDVVEVATAVAVWARWYRRTAPRPAAGPVRGRTSPGRGAAVPR